MYRNLDKFQVEAVTSSKKNLLVVAAPGSGKTTVIINRVVHLINEKNVNPDNIIVITFTKAAALNMKNRFLGLASGSKAPFFGTLHALFYKILRRAYGEINIIEAYNSFKVINNTLVQYLDEVSEDKVKEILNNISIFKSSFIKIEDFVPSVDKDIFKKCYKNYEEYKSSKGLLDFDDLQIKCKLLFEKEPMLLQRYRKLFKYILVDEFQDCDGLQIGLLKTLAEDNSLFAVGDEDQCIYSFRGSKPECMVNFSQHFKKGHKIYLSYNYRSAHNIVELSKKIIINNKIRNSKNIIPFRKDNKTIVWKNTYNEGQQTEKIIDIISKQNSEEFSYKDNAILYRTNMESRSLIDGFIRKKIPFVILDKEYNFYEHFICKDLISYLKLSIDPFDRESFIRIINKPFRYISRSNLDIIKEYKYKEDCFYIFKNYCEAADFQMKVMDKLKSTIQSLNKMSLRSAIDYIIMDLAYIDYLREYCNKFKLSIEELEEIMEEFKSSAEGYNSIISFLAHIEVFKEEVSKNKPTSNEEGVIISTIHGVKGMEFKNVYVINCNEDNIPHINSMENIEEERRLFYVAVTRAIDNLYLFSTRNIRGKMKEKSRFIEECGIENEYIGKYKKGDKIFHKAFKEGIIQEIKEKEIDIKFNDIVRKFDLDILVANGLIEKI